MSDRIEIYRTTVRRKWRWRYVAANGNILADSGQGYSRRIDPPHDRIELPAEQLGDLLDEARSAVSTLHAVATVETLRPEVHRVCRELADRLDHAIRSVDDTKRKARS